MIVGDDRAIRVDDEAGTTCLHRVPLRAHLRPHAAERELPERRRHLRLIVIAGRIGLQPGGDRDDGRLHLRDEIGEVRQRLAGHAAAGRIDRRAGRGLGCGEAGMADGEAAECGAGQQNAGHGGAAPMPRCARCLGGKGHGCSFGNFLDIQGGKPVWRRRHGRKCTRSGERSLGAAIKPLSCRLNLCHSSDRYGLDGYAAAWVGMGWRAGCDRAVASGTAKCLQKLAKWPNSRRRPTRWKVADE